jgi:CheY-like chemotaxis protein
MTSRVLIVDDDETLRLVATRQLGRLGFDVHVAQDGKQAVEVFEEFRPDLVLMDIHMPEMDGLEAASLMRGIQGQDGRPSKLVIIAMTASKIRQVVIEAGLDDYLFKPFLFEELKELLSKWVEMPDISPS